MNRVSIIFIVFLLIILAVILEGTIVNFPFVFFIGTASLILIKRIPVYIAVVILGIVIDSLRVTNFGLTPIFLLGVMSIVFIYEKYTGSKDFVVATIVTALAGFLYAHFLNYSTFLTVLFIGLSTIGWYSYRRITKGKKLMYV